MADDNSLFDRARSFVARLGPGQDGNPSVQARDEDPHTVGREEFREEADELDIGRFVREYNRNPLIRVPIQNFASDVTEPGVSVDVDTEDDADVPVVPDSAPDEYAGRDLDDALEQWLSQCYIDGWSYHGDIGALFENVIKDRRGRRGTAIIEHVYDDARERERLMKLRPVRVETVTAYTREGKRIVLRGDDDAGSFDTIAVSDYGDPVRDIAPKTPAGQTAAIAQFDDVFGSQEREEIPFAYGDISFSAYDSDTGVLFGRPDSATILNRARSLRKKLRHVDQSVTNTAFGNILAQVETQQREVVESVRDNLDVNIKDRGVRDENPQTVSATNAEIDVHEIDASVPDVVDIIQQEIEFILTAMPTPLYRVGFAGDINRDVTSEQGEDYRDAVKRERRRLEDDFRRMLRLKAKGLLLGNPHTDESLDVDVSLRIRPSTSESPLRDEEFDAGEFSNLMSGLSTAAGPKGGATAILPKEVIIDTVLDMDSEEVLEDDAPPGDNAPAMPAQSDAVQAAFDDFTDANLAAGPFSDIPVLPDDLETLTEAWVNRWAEWIAAGRPEIPDEAKLVEPHLFAELDWNPAAHPRDPETGKFVERPFNSPVPATALAEMSTKQTLQYLDNQGEDIDAVLSPGSGVTVDGVPNDATSIGEIPEEPDSPNPDIPTPDIEYTIGEEPPDESLGQELVGEDVKELKFGDVISVNGTAVEVQDVSQNGRNILYDGGGGDIAEADAGLDDITAISTSVPGADVNDSLVGLPVPESDRGPDLTESGVESLRDGDVIAVNGKRAHVIESNRKFVKVDRGNGAEDIPVLGNTIEPVDTKYDITTTVLEDADQEPEDVPSPSDRDIGTVPDDYGELAQQADDILQSGQSPGQTVREIEQEIDDRTDVEVSLKDFAPTQAAEVAAGVSAVLEREGGLPDTLDKIESGMPSNLKQRFNVPIAVHEITDDEVSIGISVSQFKESKVAEMNDDGWMTAEKPRDVMIHELGHAVHYQRVQDGDGNGFDSGGVPLDTVTENEIEAEVSEYAAETFTEFVAEGYVERLVKGGIEETELNLPGLLDYALGEE